MLSIEEQQKKNPLYTTQIHTQLYEEIVKSLKPLNTIILDLGNVLIHINPMKSIRLIAQDSAYDTERILHYFSTSDTINNYEKGIISSRQFYELVNRDLNLTCSITRFKHLWLSMFTPIEPMIQWLESIKNSYQLMILSNTNAWHINHCERIFPFIHWFHHRLYSYRLGLAKPDPRIFKKALTLACTTPESILFIDDKEENVIAASALGIRTIHFTGVESFFKTWHQIRCN